MGTSIVGRVVIGIAVLKPSHLQICGITSRFVISAKNKQHPQLKYSSQSLRFMVTMSANTKEEGNVLGKPAQMAIQIFKDAVESVKPKKLLTEKFKLENESELTINAGDGTLKRLNLNHFNKIYLVGFGKAVLPMAEQVMTVLGKKIDKCIVNIPEGFRDPVVDGIEIYRGANNNIPDEASFKGTKQIVELVQNIQPNDLLIVLITGGGSALFTYPLHPITVEELGSLVRNLSRAGATIQELNSVRKRLSRVQGGGLITLCNCSTILGLVLSDVLDDPLDIIASGPTVQNTDLESRAKEIIDKYSKVDSVTENIKQALDYPVTIPPSKNVTNVIIGNNSVALETAAKTAKQLNLYPIILSKTLSGNASEVGELLGHLTQAIAYLFRAKTSDQFSSAYVTTILNTAEKLNLNNDKITELIKVIQDEKIQSGYDGVCVLLGGETTVVVVGNGVGGRNQELALSAGIKMDTCSNSPYMNGKVALLSAGTDGYDGPCDAAGAVVDSSMLQRGYEKKLSPSEHLRDNNSYPYYKENFNGAYHIITGHTDTNVMDLIIIIVVK